MAQKSIPVRTFNTVRRTLGLRAVDIVERNIRRGWGELRLVATVLSGYQVNDPSTLMSKYGGHCVSKLCPILLSLAQGQRSDKTRISGVPQGGFLANGYCP
jgi:hypothetical protein